MLKMIFATGIPLGAAPSSPARCASSPCSPRAPPASAAAAPAASTSPTSPPAASTLSGARPQPLGRRRRHPHPSAGRGFVGTIEPDAQSRSRTAASSPPIPPSSSRSGACCARAETGAAAHWVACQNVYDSRLTMRTSWRFCRIYGRVVAVISIISRLPIVCKSFIDQNLGKGWNRRSIVGVGVLPSFVPRPRTDWSSSDQLKVMPGTNRWHGRWREPLCCKCPRSRWVDSTMASNDAALATDASRDVASALRFAADLAGIVVSHDVPSATCELSASAMGVRIAAVLQMLLEDARYAVTLWKLKPAFGLRLGLLPAMAPNLPPDTYSYPISGTLFGKIVADTGKSGRRTRIAPHRLLSGYVRRRGRPVAISPRYHRDELGRSRMLWSPSVFSAGRDRSDGLARLLLN